jgi:hypothetical protein
MKTLLICPVERAGFTALSEFAPLATLPVLGKCLIEHWLEHLVTLGAREVRVLVADRPEQVRALVGDGARWGLPIEVTPELCELTPAEASAKYRAESDTDWLAAPNDVVVLDHLPGLPEAPLFASYENWFAAMLKWMPRATTPERIGLREIQPGVWTGLHTRVSSRAELRAPCWIGENVFIEPDAIIGPGVILEDRVFVEAGADISNSIIFPETFVGQLSEVRDSLAWGDTLINWRNSATVKVPDAFLLGALRKTAATPVVANWAGRLAALMVMAITAPAALFVALKANARGEAAFQTSTAAIASGGTLAYQELTGTDSWLRRWPQLWSIARGDFAWVGNRPLTPVQAAQLTSDFERLWLSAPVGLVSLADAEGCREPHSDEARAHASFYAVRADWQLNCSILARVLSATLIGAFKSRERQEPFVQFQRQMPRSGA